MDDQVLSLVELTGDGQAREERISIDKIEVERLGKKFDLLLREAVKLEDALKSLKQLS